MNKNHTVKMIGAVLSGVFVSLYILLIVISLFVFDSGSERLITIVFGGILLAVVAAIVYQIIARVKEIKGGEEDDLGKY